MHGRRSLEHADIAMLLVIDMASRGRLFPELPRKFVLHQTITVGLHEGMSASAKIIPRNLSTNMVGEVPVDIESQPLNPGREAHVDSRKKRTVNLVPVLFDFPANTSRVTVVEISEGGQPELEDEEGDEIELPQRTEL